MTDPVMADDAGGRAAGLETKPGVSARRVGEWVLRLVALVLLAWTWWRSGHPARVASATVVDQDDLPAMLGRWTTGAAPGAVHVRCTVVPDATARAWLGAIARTGSRVTWSAATGLLPATAIDVEPVADPRDVERVSVAAPVASRVVLGDPLGVIDSIRVPHGTAVLTLPPPAASLRASVSGTVARAGAVDSVVLKRIYVVGSAGWEAKFIMRALEEEGWGVDAHLIVAPKNDVVPKTPIVLDTAHYAAVVAVDSAAGAEAGRIARYVTDGGGLIVGPAAVAALRAVTPGALGPTIRGAATLADSAPQVGLTLAPVTSVVPGAVVLGSRGAMTTVAARRVGSAGGRVVQIGYTDTWRWRMAAGDSGAAAYRAWWAGMIAAVAYAPVIERVQPATADPAPFVAAVEQLGAPSAVPTGVAARGLAVSPAWVFGIIVLALVAEWASRRLRGVK